MMNARRNAFNARAGDRVCLAVFATRSAKKHDQNDNGTRVFTRLPRDVLFGAHPRLTPYDLSAAARRRQDDGVVGRAAVILSRPTTTCSRPVSGR